ncbi:MAG TPA: type 2 lanthipeptide synthetase LanM family protein [Actinokineospora sp.]|nr:type 2 lanthipeptide synthetase LanM family protein [Actinokineospora sp.]
MSRGSDQDTARSRSWWTAGQRPTERDGGRPNWADFIDAAVASAPVSETGFVKVAGSVTDFAAAFRPLTRAAHAMVERRVDADPGIVDLDAVCDGWASRLGNQLARAGARTLVLELGRKRAALPGATSRDRFAAFVASTGTRDGLAALFGAYPVLARVLGQTCLHAADALVEALGRFVADRDAITMALTGADAGPLLAVDAAGGDPHHGGRSVAILRFACGAAVVYKPRPVGLLVHFGEITHWLGGKVGRLRACVPRAVCGDGYGWVEFVRPLPCDGVADVDTYYRRLGALLALLHALGGTDFHHENLIAHADQPVLIDVETLFHPTLPHPRTAGPDPAADALACSVLRTALLPHLIIGELGALDVSGLGGDPGVQPREVVDWADAGTDRMRLVRRAAAARAGSNRPSAGGRAVEPRDFRSALLEGFRVGYDAIVAHRAELAGLLARCSGDAIRVVVRSTELYGTLLDESTHPDVLRDAADREDVFGLLCDAADPVRAPLVSHEITDLWRGDIPLFTTTPDSMALHPFDGAPIHGVLAATGLAAAQGKITTMGDVDRRDQHWLIEAAFAIRATGTPPHHTDAMQAPVAAESPDPDRITAAACGIADQIAAGALGGDARVNWLGLQLVDDRHWAVLPMGAALGDGFTGVALFFAELARLAGVDRYRDLAARAITPIPGLIAAMAALPDLAAEVGPGATLGLGGVCYALSRLTTLLDDAQVLSWLDSAIAVLSDVETGDCGFAAGNAGGLAAMSAVVAEHALTSAVTLAARYHARLAAAPVPATSGFATGAAGVAWALGRSTPQPLPSTPGWCSGMAGHLAQAPHARVIEALAVQPPLRDMTLCHGETGVIDMLTQHASTTPAAAIAARSRVSVLLGELAHHGPRCGTPDEVPTPGLLTGLSGIGYGLLRAGFPDTVPSALTLQPGPPRKQRPQEGVPDERRHAARRGHTRGRDATSRP